MFQHTRMSLSYQYANNASSSSDNHAMWQAWQAQAKPSTAGLLSDETIEPSVQAHMTLRSAEDEKDRNVFSFVLGECQLSDDEWERHCTESIGFCSDTTSELAPVPLRRSNHS